MGANTSKHLNCQQFVRLWLKILWRVIVVSILKSYNLLTFGKIIIGNIVVSALSLNLKHLKSTNSQTQKNQETVIKCLQYFCFCFSVFDGVIIVFCPFIEFRAPRNLHVSKTEKHNIKYIKQIQCFVILCSGFDGVINWNNNWQTLIPSWDALCWRYLALYYVSFIFDLMFCFY